MEFSFSCKLKRANKISQVSFWDKFRFSLGDSQSRSYSLCSFRLFGWSGEDRSVVYVWQGADDGRSGGLSKSILHFIHLHHLHISTQHTKEEWERKKKSHGRLIKAFTSLRKSFYSSYNFYHFKQYWGPESEESEEEKQFHFGEEKLSFAFSLSSFNAHFACDDFRLRP